MTKEQLYLKVLQDVSDRLNAAVEHYDKSNDADQLRASVVAILKGSNNAHSAVGTPQIKI